MKKFLYYILIFIIIIFILPTILTKKQRKIVTDIQEAVKSQEESKPQDEEKQEIDLSSDKKIRLLHTATNEVEEVDLEQYICNVVSSEMPASYEAEALKAQAVVARTYTLYKVKHPKHDNADICDSSTCCQAWLSKEDRMSKWEETEREKNWAKIEKCVADTKGKIITYNNEPINAFFHSNSGGTTETPNEVWGGENLPYLQVVQTSGEDGYKQFSSEVSFTFDELITKLKEKYGDISIDFSKNDDIKTLDYTQSGRVKTIKFGNHELSGVETRTILGLKSTNFEFYKNDNSITFIVKGYGHGVGMSQTGADSMAKDGSTFEDIIHHFYSNVEIKNL